MTPATAETHDGDIDVDVAIVGGGPAGIAATVRAAESGRRVLMVDEGPREGGQIWRHRAKNTARLPRSAQQWIARLHASSASVLPGASIVDARRDAGGGYTLVAEQHLAARVVRANALIVATGARERWIPFPGWTLPGVFGVGGAQALLKSGLSFAGKRVVVAGTGPLLLPVAASLAAGGARVGLVAEQAGFASVTRFAIGLWRKPATLAQAARYRAAFPRTPYRSGWWVTAARGDDRVRQVTVTNGRATRTIDCDVLCVGFGLVPNTELARLLGCDVERGAVVVDQRMATSRENVYAAGEICGIGGSDAAIVEGEIAGLSATGRAADAARLGARRRHLRHDARAMDRAFALRDELRAITTPETIVCRCEDVSLGAIGAAHGIREAKLQTRAGMGPCQGRVCGAALEFLLGWNNDTVRAPIEPALLSTLVAGSSGGASSNIDARS